MKYVNILFILILLTLCVTPQQVDAASPLDALFPFLKAPVDSDYKIDGETVYVDNDYVRIEATPHTLTSSGWVTVKFWTKQYSGDLDICYGFNGIDKVEALKTEVYEEKDGKQQWSKNDKVISKETKDYKGSKAWQSQNLKTVAKNTVYTIRVWIEVPFNGLDKSIGKYTIGIKPAGSSIDKAWVLDPWYNASWDYRKEIVIDQTDDLGADVSYQIKLLIGKTSSATGEDVDLNGHCQDDFDDLRFTKSDGTTLLDYWIESVSGSGDALLATVWVEAVLLDDAADTTIYMYYGNAAAAAASNGANTFVFFDDFSGTLSDLFNTWGTAANSSGICQITGADSGIKSKSTFAIPCRARTLSKTLNNADYSMPLQMRLEADETDMSRILRYSGRSTTKWSFDNCNEGAATGSASTATIDTSYHIFEIQRIASNNHKMFFDNAEVASETNATYVPNESLTVGARANGQSIYVDWMLITKFTANEPTWSSFGSEEPVPFSFYAITLPSTGWNTDWAILNGNFSTPPTGDGITQHGFDYGLTTSYGSSWTESGNWTTPAVFSKTLTGLGPATVYHYRAKVYYGATWYYGEDRTVATKGSPQLYEYWNTGGDGDSFKINAANWTYQTFTTNITDISHSVTSFKLKLKRVGTPGTITASIRNTSNSTTGQTCWSYPTGEDLITATYDGDTVDLAYTWYEFVPSVEVCLSANTTYAIVVRVLSGDSSNYIQWQTDFGGGYTGGNAGYCTDSGVTWATNCPTDQLFEIWGNPCLEVLDAKVFESYIEDGDWLICVLYKNFFQPYYEQAKDVQSLFYLQLADGTTVKASTIVPEWGYRPACIYLSATEVAALEWGEDYHVRIYCNFGAYPYAEYTLQSTDWLGSDLARLDSWVRTSAKLMEDYYETTYTEYVSGKGLVLNEAGGVIFATNIPELDTIRPDIFKIVSNTVDYETGDYTQDLQADLVWQTMWGPQITRAFTLTGNAYNLQGNQIGMLIGFLVYAMVALLCFRPGHALAAVVIPTPILIIVWGTGLWELAAMGIFLAVAALLLTWQLWFKSR